MTRTEQLLPVLAKWRDENKALLAKLPDALLPWFSQSARDLPWRRDREPYHVWLSEIMLQQTRVEAVRGYYARFLSVFPTIRDLADAPEDQVLKLWEGLGYYSRARNLQKAAKVVTEQSGGVFPTEYDAIRALPGVGDYTAGAIASICFDRPTPAVDGNVLRVVSRVTGLYLPVTEEPVKSAVRSALAEVYPHGSCGKFTQSLMELGATVCVPNGAPRCWECPVRAICRADADHTAELLPVRAEKKARKIEEKTVFVLRCGDRLAVCRRPDHGLLAGLWQLPETDGCLDLAGVRETLAAWGVSARLISEPYPAVHVFTHREWHMRCYAVQCGDMPDRFQWVTDAELAGEIALPTAYRVCLKPKQVDSPAASAGKKQKRMVKKMNYSPILTTPCYKSMPWGGTNLNGRFGKHSEFALTGESWEAADHFNGKTFAADGEYKGMSFGEIAKAMGGTDFLGRLTTDGAFPVLFKLIDARDKLSVQVHPNDEYAKRDGDRGKTEMWIVLESQPGSGLYLGFEKPITREEYGELIRKNELESALHFVPTKVGDTFFLPPGLVHAIGGGLVIAEIQQSSDATYRVYDWGRMGLDGKPRQLHIEKALDVSRTDLKGENGAYLTVRDGETAVDYLTACSLFATQRIHLKGAYTVPANGASFSAVFCADGSLTVSDCDGSVTLQKGQTAVVPAAAGSFTVEGDAEAYRFFVPDLSADVVEPLRAAGFAEEDIRKIIR